MFAILKISSIIVYNSSYQGEKMAKYGKSLLSGAGKSGKENLKQSNDNIKKMAQGLVRGNSKKKPPKKKG
jgi:hypothetical protein